jgi:hypothetical protein
MSAADDRITEALGFALQYGGIDGEHHKMWVIDQMVRALTGCPMVKFIGTDSREQKYEFEAQGTSDEYIKWVNNARSGEDGPETYDWDVGVVP